jgi:hypothetical protein
MDYRNFVQIFVGRNRTKKPPKTSKTSLLPMGWDGFSVAICFFWGILYFFTTNLAVWLLPSASVMRSI